jgi:hypothetical protein
MYRANYRQGLRRLERPVHLVATDPPFSPKTHDGHRAGLRAYDTAVRRDIDYDAWTGRQMLQFIRHTAPHCVGWFAVVTDSELGPTVRRGLEKFGGRYTFPPLPVIIPGMTVRRSGDGPSSESVALYVARPRNVTYSRWGTTRGYYMAPGAAAGLPREPLTVVGGKPLEVCRQIVRDYSRRGETVLDPCAGGGTMVRAAVLEGRTGIGFEPNPGRFEMAVALLQKPCTRTLELEPEPVLEQHTLAVEMSCGACGAVWFGELALGTPITCPVCGGAPS